MSWTLSPAEYDLTVEKFAKINARAAKRGFTGRLDLTAELTEKWEYVTDGGDTRARTMATAPDGSVHSVPIDSQFRIVPGIWVKHMAYAVTITGEPPCYAGWAFLATLDWEEAGVIVHAVPGAEGIDRDALRAGWCDHCKTNRQRRGTYLVANVETGEQLQVGSTCIKDFLGWTGRPTLYVFDEVADELDMTGMRGWASEHMTDVDTVLAIAWAAVQRFGYVKADSGYGTPTKEVVRQFLFDNSQRARDLIRELTPHLEVARAKGAECREFILSEDFAGDSDYVLNLKTLAASESVNPKSIGILASAPAAWARHHEQELARKARDEKPSVHFGEVKQRVEFTGVIEMIRWIPNTYGPYETTDTLYKLRAEDGRIAVWKTNGDALGDTEGVTVTIKGTIKGHDEWNGVPETRLTRCKLVEKVSA